MADKAGPKGYSRNTNPFGFGKGQMPEGHPSRKVKIKPMKPESSGGYKNKKVGPKKHSRKITWQTNTGTTKYSEGANIKDNEQFN